MIYLIELYKHIQDKATFISVFSNIDYNNEMWNIDADSGIFDTLYEYFNIEIQCPKELSVITNCILDKKDLSFLSELKL